MEQVHVSMMLSHNRRTDARYLIVRTQRGEDCSYDVFVLNEEGEAEMVSEEAQMELMREIDELMGGSTTIH